jgi:hypothetical protein
MFGNDFRGEEIRWLECDKASPIQEQLAGLMKEHDPFRQASG